MEQWPTPFSRRRREIGIRIAIGATHHQVIALVLSRTAILLSVGAFVGSLAALTIGDLVSPVLYDVSPRDPAAIALACLLMSAVALTATWVPAVRAARVEPSSALRAE
jgi:ABC-type antimicrobial peptide transport system permease subunit